MIRTQAQLQGWEWDITLNGPNPIVHFFNEPERGGITAENAAEIWTKQMLLLKEKGKKICGPCVASDPAGEAWLEDFMKRIDGNLPDFLGVHYYGDNGDAAIEYIEKMHQKWPQLPVIVTEIASISRDGSEVVKFTSQLANWMDTTDWIYEYAFFGCMRECAGKCSTFPSGPRDMFWKQVSGAFCQYSQNALSRLNILFMFTYFSS
jgi:hypothetical protein